MDWIVAAAVAVMSMIVFFVAGGISKPITNVALTLKDISEGEGDLTQTIDIHSKDEIGDLARYFNATLEKIKFLLQKLQDILTWSVPWYQILASAAAERRGIKPSEFNKGLY